MSLPFHDTRYRFIESMLLLLHGRQSVQERGPRAVNTSAMKHLNLTRTPPRSPQEKLGGLLMLARTIDKLRASLPGGDLGVYQMAGFSARLLTELGIEEDALRESVINAETEAEVVAYVHAHSDASKYPAINESFAKLRIADRLDNEAFVEKYPIVKKLPPETSLLEMLEYDDCDAFLQ